MREDFHKVVIERPRSGSSLPSPKTRWSTNHYDPDREYALPKRESSSWGWIPHRKYFNDHLAPLQRYLDKQVGRPWRKVEGEFRKILDGGTVIGRHLLDHAEGMVEKECRLDSNGRVVQTRWGRPVDGLYVHPTTGLLLRAKPRRADEARERRKRIDEAKAVRLDDATRAEKLNGLWFLFIRENRWEEVIELRRDAAGKTVLHRTRRRVVRKKQANTDEVRRIRAALEASIP